MVKKFQKWEKGFDFNPSGSTKALTNMWLLRN